MPFIGNKPTAVPLSGADLEDNIISTAKIQDNAVTAPKYVEPIPLRNIIINGDMSIAQRGTSTSGVTTSDGYYACDRWRTQTDTGTWTISQDTDVPTGQGYYYSMKLNCTSAGTSNADEVTFIQRIEGQFLQYLKFGTSNAESLTASFWIKTNKTGTYSAVLENQNSDQLRSVSFDYTVNSSNTWEKKTITFPGDTSRIIKNTNSNELDFRLYFSSAYGTGVTNTWQNYSANYWSSGNLAGLGGSTSDYVNITGVQLEAGTSASDFEFLPNDVNKNRCLRYYYVHAEGNSKQIGNAGYYNNSYITSSIQFPVEMRASPSVVTTSGTNYYNIYRNNASDNFDGTWGIQQPTPFAAGIDATTGASGTAGQYGRAVTNNASALVAFSSEL